MATQKALVLYQFGKIPTLQEFPRPQAPPGSLLIKIEAATINPSDRYRNAGAYFQRPLPFVPGLQGAGRVVEANGQDIKEWVGKRVSFFSPQGGSWQEYTHAKPDVCFPLTEDVPIQSAASGIVNPLTVIGMTEIYSGLAVRKGIVHTAAASALGRQLNKRCISLGIPLLNIVRRQEQAAILRSEGAQHVIVTQGEWHDQYKEAIKNHGFNVFFDCLGGGAVTEFLIMNLNPHSWAYIYGSLSGEPFSLKSGISLCKGITVSGYMLMGWYETISAERKKQIKQAYSGWLKGQLATHSYKILNFSQVTEGIQLSVSHATDGKITLVPN